MKTTQVTVDGRSFLVDDLTLDEAESIEKATGERWGTLTPLYSASHCREIMRAFLLRDRTEEQAQAVLSKMTVKEAIDSIEVVEDDLPDSYEDGVPLVGAEPPTNGSAPSSPGGHRMSLGASPSAT